VAEGITVTISTVDGTGNASPLTTYDATFPVRPEPGKPARFVSPFEFRGDPPGAPWEYWANYLTTTIGGNISAGPYRTYNSFYLLDRFSNVTFGYGTTSSPPPWQNLWVTFTNQLSGGSGFNNISFPGYETDVSWSNAGGSLPNGTFDAPLTVNYNDPEYGTGSVVKHLTLSFISGVRSALVSFQQYDLRFGVDDGMTVMTVPPGASGSAIPTTTNPRSLDPAGQVTPRRLNFQIVTGTNVPLEARRTRARTTFGASMAASTSSTTRRRRTRTFRPRSPEG